MSKTYKNETHVLELSLLDINGDFSFGLEVSYEVRKSTDGSLEFSGTMSEITPGIYKAEIIPTETGEYAVKYTTPEGYENGLDTFTVEEDKLSLILGLSQENYRIFNPVYDINNNTTSSTIKTYATAEDCEADENEIAEYQMTATYNVSNLMTAYKVVKV